MKIILSRKGFDSVAGGCASPIIDGKTLLSLPIPVKEENKDIEKQIRYSDLNYNGVNYAKLISDLNPRFSSEFCHLDPDIRSGIRNEKRKWKPAFGQAWSAQKVLKSTNVDIGDIFLFFGWFRGVQLKNGKYRYLTKRTGTDFVSYANLHVIYGYMQVGEIIDDPHRIKREFGNHPHSGERYLKSAGNTIYIPTENLEFPGLNNIPGYGTLDLAPERILTKEGCARSFWDKARLPKELHMLNSVGCKDYADCLNFVGQWQELVLEADSDTEAWVKKIIVGK